MLSFDDLLTGFAAMLGLFNFYYTFLRPFKLIVVPSDKVLIGALRQQGLVMGLQGVLVNTGRWGRAVVDYGLRVVRPDKQEDTWPALLWVDEQSIKISMDGIQVQSWSPVLTKWLGPGSEKPFFILFLVPLNALASEGDYHLSLLVRVGRERRWRRFKLPSLRLDAAQVSGLRSGSGVYWIANKEVMNCREMILTAPKEGSC